MSGESACLYLQRVSLAGWLAGCLHSFVRTSPSSHSCWSAYYLLLRAQKRWQSTVLCAWARIRRETGCLSFIRLPLHSDFDFASGQPVSQSVRVGSQQSPRSLSPPRPRRARAAPVSSTFSSFSSKISHRKSGRRFASFLPPPLSPLDWVSREAPLSLKAVPSSSLIPSRPIRRSSFYCTALTMNLPCSIFA